MDLPREFFVIAVDRWQFQAGLVCKAWFHQVNAVVLSKKVDLCFQIDRGQKRYLYPTIKMSLEELTLLAIESELMNSA